MPNTALTQIALAADAGFQQRIASALLSIAAQTLAEDPATVNHGARVVYANKVINGPAVEAAKVAPFLVMRPNVNNFVTSCQFQQATAVVVSTSGDADLQSQIATDWNWLAAAAAAR
jgi:hypothetical protein